MSDLAISGAINNSNSLDTRTLKDQVVRLLRQAILSGKISAGGRLNESQLARELGVSRVPIREALQPARAARFGCGRSSTRKIRHQFK